MFWSIYRITRIPQPGLKEGAAIGACNMVMHGNHGAFSLMRGK